MDYNKVVPLLLEGMQIDFSRQTTIAGEQQSAEVPESYVQHVSTRAKLLLRVNEAADVLSISRTAMYQLVMTKQVFSVKVRGSRRIPMRALEAYVDQLMAVQKAG